MKFEAKRFKVVGLKNVNAWSDELIKRGARNMRMTKGKQEGFFTIMFDWPRSIPLPSAPRWL